MERGHLAMQASARFIHQRPHLQTTRQTHTAARAASQLPRCWWSKISTPLEEHDPGSGRKRLHERLGTKGIDCEEATPEYLASR